jgi:hypothetical protein
MARLYLHLTPAQPIRELGFLLRRQFASSRRQSRVTLRFCLLSRFQPVFKTDPPSPPCLLPPALSCPLPPTSFPPVGLAPSRPSFAAPGPGRAAGLPPALASKVDKKTKKNKTNPLLELMLRLFYKNGLLLSTGLRVLRHSIPTLQLVAHVTAR